MSLRRFIREQVFKALEEDSLAKKKDDSLIKKDSDENPVDMDKLMAYTAAIETICNGEYGTVYFNEKNFKIFVCVGDANPFESEDLENFMKDAVAKDYQSSEKIEIEIEGEAGPNNEEEGWKEIRDGKLVDLDY